MATREKCPTCRWLGVHARSCPENLDRDVLEGDEREVFRAAFAAQSVLVPLEQVCADAGTRAVEIWRLHLKSDTPSLLKDPDA